MSERDVPLEGTTPQYAEGHGKVGRAPSQKSRWFELNGPVAVNAVEVWGRGAGEKWENPKEYKEVHKKYGLAPSKPVSGALRAGTRAFEQEQERLRSEARGGMMREQVAAENEEYYAKLATAGTLKPGPVWEGLSSSDYTTSDSESESD